MSDPISALSAENAATQMEGLPAPIPAQPGPVGGSPAAGAKERSASLWADAWRQLIRKPVFIMSAIYVLIVSSWAIVPSLWTSKVPDLCDIHFAKLKPSAEHWFGTTNVGCDYYAHAIYGARPSLGIALVSTIGVLAVGVLMGTLAGFYGGWVDAVISRITDIVLSLPFLLGVLVFLAVLKSFNVWTISLVLVLLGWPSMTRLMRGSVLATKNLDFVAAAKALGSTNSRLMFRHILPNAIAPIIVVAPVLLGGFVSVEATLTFLGAGLQAPAVSWGVMISAHQSIWQDYPYLLLFPVGILVGTVLSFILMGDALRDALDPKLR